MGSFSSVDSNLLTRRKSMTEASLEEGCVTWYRLQYGKSGLIIKIPNEGKRSAAKGAEMKRRGLTAGACDLLIIAARSSYFGLFIELKKSEQEKTTEAQEKFIARVIKDGYAAEICKSFEEFESVVKKYMTGRYNQQAINEILTR